jgi:hypothetical protein
MKKLIEAIDDARPKNPGTRYAVGYDDGLKKAEQILENAGVVSMGLHKAVMAERDVAIAQLEEHGIQFGANAPDVARVVRCGKCRYWDSYSGCCEFWHGVRHPAHYCGEGERNTNG